MSLKKTVIRGRTFENDFIKFNQDNRFEYQSQLSASVDADLHQPIKEYDNGMKVLLFPTDIVVDTGDQKWTLRAEKSLVNPDIYYRDVKYWFEELI